MVTIVERALTAIHLEVATAMAEAAVTASLGSAVDTAENQVTLARDVRRSGQAAAPHGGSPYDE